MTTTASTLRSAEVFEPHAALWGQVARRPLRRVAWAPHADTPARNRPLPVAELGDLWAHLQQQPARDVDAGLEHLLRQLCQMMGADRAEWTLHSSPRAGRDSLVAALCWNHSLRGVVPAQGHSATQGHTLCVDLQPSTGLRARVQLLRSADQPDFDDTDRQTLSLALGGLGRWLKWLALSHAPHPGAGPLPPHQRKVLLLLVTGLSEKQIASELNLSTNTAHQYVTALYRRFGVRNRPSLAAKWLGDLA